MFTRLRNRFLVLNMVLISVIMLFSFSVFYILTYNNVYRQIDMELNRISEFDRKPSREQGPGLQPSAVSEPPHDRSVSFIIETDKEWNTARISSIFDMESEFYETARKEAVSHAAESGTLKLDGTYWTYLKRTTAEGHKLVFLDTSPQHAILSNMVYTFVVVGSITVILIFLISRYFANKSIKPVRDAFEKQKQFIADASHELKTPLAVINTNVDVLMSSEDSCMDSQSKWLRYIKSEVERMTRLTNDLLYLAQLDYSDTRMIYSNFSLSEAVENVIMTMEAVIYENEIVFEYDVDPGLVVNGSAEQLKQVVMILLDNSVKYVNTKGRIVLSLKKSGSSALLSVSNTGEGIPEEQLARIFNRFYRTDKSRARKSGGYGLGLAIAKSIIEQHRGKISARSVVNESTAFAIELPLVNRQ